MPITINGSGTVTGITAGGLPDGVVTTADIAANAVTYAKIGTTEQGQLCKAWVNFNGTGTPAARASYNVSSITDHGTGDYTINFTTALVDANYAVTVATTATGAGGPVITINASAAVPTASAVRLLMGDTSAVKDVAYNNVAIFR